ncbi:MAG: hypothetical protein KDE47_15845, partial [Caldilineaceae bacterium]|nr:hypothetical protein [Caldilineaceae bacterium]
WLVIGGKELLAFVCWPSSVVPRLSALVCRPSSVVPRLSSLVCRPSSIVCPLARKGRPQRLLAQ